MADRNVWWGAGVSVGGMATIIGASETLMFWVNDADRSLTMLTLVFGFRAGAGVHGGGSIVVGKLNGVEFANQINGAKGAGVDFAFDVGAKFADLVKGVKYGDKLAELVRNSNDMSKLKEVLANDGTKTVVNGMLGNLSTTSSEPSYAILGLPLAGKGLGAGAWQEWQRMYPITDAGLWDVAKAKWKIVKIAGRPILRIHGIPEEDGTEIMVTGIRNVGANNAGHLIFAPKDRVAAGWTNPETTYGFLGEARGLALYDQPSNRYVQLGGRDGLDLSRYALAGVKTTRGLVPVPNQEMKLQLTIMKTRNGQQSVKHAWRTKTPISVRTDQNGQIASVLSNGAWSN